MNRSFSLLAPFVACSLLAALGCGRRAAPEPTSRDRAASATPASASAAPEPETKSAAKPAAVTATAGDPENGDFTLEEALAGLEGSGPAVADIETDLGTLKCELYGDKAPITVANFIGLARGNRAWKDKGQWVKKPLYDGTVFHRVIKGFMIQGGDPNHDGSGGPGYVIPDEIWEGAHHDTRGQLCMANRGPNTNGSQFFIMDGKAAHLDGGYTIFGKCGPEALIEKLSSVEVKRDQAVKPTLIKRVTVSRSASK